MPGSRPAHRAIGNAHPCTMRLSSRKLAMQHALRYAVSTGFRLAYGIWRALCLVSKGRVLTTGCTGLQAELSAMRAELMGMGGAKKAIDEENRQLKRELVLVHQQMNMVLARVLGAAAGAVGAPTGTPPLNLAALAGMLGGPTGLTGATESAQPGLHLAGAVAAGMGHGSVNGVGAPSSGGPQVRWHMHVPACWIPPGLAHIVALPAIQCAQWLW